MQCSIKRSEIGAENKNFPCPGEPCLLSRLADVHFVCLAVCAGRNLEQTVEASMAKA